MKSTMKSRTSKIVSLLLACLLVLSTIPLFFNKPVSADITSVIPGGEVIWMTIGDPNVPLAAYGGEARHNPQTSGGGMTAPSIIVQLLGMLGILAAIIFYLCHKI